jgi:hypothetical protein
MATAYELVEIDMSWASREDLLRIICESADKDISVNQLFSNMLRDAADAVIAEYYWGC